MTYRLSALAVCAVFAIASVCQASLGPLQVKIDDGVNPAIIAVDQDPSDDNTTDGVVELNATTGIWIATVSIGISAPAIGSTTVPEMNLTSVEVSSVGSAGTIEVSLTGLYNANEPVIPGFIHSFGGTSQGIATSDLYIGTSAFHQGTVISSLSPPVIGGLTGTFEAQTQGPATGTDSDYWLTLVATITHTAGVDPKSSSFGAQIDPQPIPEPASIAIWTLMAGIGGLIWMRRRSK